MTVHTEEERSLSLQRFVELIGSNRRTYVQTGRKFDKVYVDGAVRYFVARVDQSGDIRAGDIYGAKSKLAPNFRWFFGTLENAVKWDWSGYHGKPIDDKSVLQVKGYANYVHYKRIEA